MPPPGPPPGPPPPPPDEPPMPDAPARPGWRTVIKRPEPGARRKGKAAAAAAAAAATPPPPPPPVIEAPRPELPSWAQWKRKHTDPTCSEIFTDHCPLAFYSQSQLTTCCSRPSALPGCHTGASPPGTLWYFYPFRVPVSFVLISTCRARNTSAIVNDSA